MWRCRICVYETDLDDIAVTFRVHTDECICIRCYAREVGLGGIRVSKRVIAEINLDESDLRNVKLPRDHRLAPIESERTP